MLSLSENRRVRRTVPFACAAFGFLLALNLFPNSPVVAASKKEHGQELFDSKGCAQCHGTNGVGGGRGPDLQLVRKRKDKDAIAQQIHDGGGAMPAYGDILQQDEIRDLAEYLSAKRKQIVTAPSNAGDAPRSSKVKEPDGGW